MSENRYKIEKLKNLRNEMTYFWSSTFIFGAGMVAFLIKGSSMYDRVWGIIALFFTFIFFDGFMARRNKVEKLTDKLKKEEK